MRDDIIYNSYRYLQWYVDKISHENVIDHFILCYSKNQKMLFNRQWISEEEWWWILTY